MKSLFWPVLMKNRKSEIENRFSRSVPVHQPSCGSVISCYAHTNTLTQIHLDWCFKHRAWLLKGIHTIYLHCIMCIPMSTGSCLCFHTKEGLLSSAPLLHDVSQDNCGKKDSFILCSGCSLYTIDATCLSRLWFIQFEP